MLLGVLRRRLFRPTRFLRMNCRMRRGLALEPEIALQLTLGLLAAPDRLGDQFVGEDEPGVCDIFHRQQRAE